MIASFIYLVELHETKYLDLFVLLKASLSHFWFSQKLQVFLHFHGRRAPQFFSVKNINPSLRSPNWFLWFLWWQHIGGTLLGHLGWVQDWVHPDAARPGSARHPTRMAVHDGMTLGKAGES